MSTPRFKTTLFATPSRAAFVVAAAYVLLSGVWIALSDQWIATLFEDSSALTRAQTLKGWFFVAASGLVIFLLVRAAVEVSRARVQLGERLRTVLDTLPGRVYWTDSDLQLRGCNAAFAQEIGLPDPEAIERLSPDQLPGCPPSLRGDRTPERRVLKSGEPEGPVEVETEDPTGRRRWEEITHVALHDDLGNPSGVLVTMLDTTERRCAREELIHSQKLQALGEVTSGIAHDVKNALAVIRANVELLLEEGIEGDSALDALNDVRGAALSASGVIRNLLDFGRRSPVEPRPVEMAALVRELAPMFSRLLTVAYPLTLEVKEEGVGAMADPQALEHSLLNLLTNARDAMPQGGAISLRVGSRILPDQAPLRPGCVRVPGDPPAGRYIEVTVEDRGEGIPPDRLEAVLTPFFTTKPEGVGTGLGLSMVCTLMDAQGGVFELESSLGAGARVRLLFQEALLPVASTPLDAALNGPRDGRSAGAGTTILVVEDQAGLRRTVQRVLERTGYRVLTAAEGAEALRILEAESGGVDLVFADLMMPGMGGLELHRELQRRGAATRFVLTSGLAGRGEGAWVPAELEAVPVIAKPWTIPELLDGLRGALDKSVESDHMDRRSEKT